MKTNRLTDATKIFILVATVIVVCVLCAVGFKLVNEGKSSVNANSKTFNSMTSEYSNIDISLYNGSLVAGSEVVSLIKRVVSDKEYLSIEVKTLNDDVVDYNYYCKYDSDKETYYLTDEENSKIDVATEKYEYGYINPMAMFIGTIIKDANGTIICIKFEQQP